MTRTDIPSAPDERSTLLSMLSYARETALFKVRGLSDSDAHAAPISTSPLTTPATLLNHLRWVERDWLRRGVLGEDIGAPWSKEDPDGEMTEALSMDVADVIAAYEEQIVDSDDVISGLDLEQKTAKPFPDFHPNVRWVILHLIEETARHNGHLDLLRELADGSVGD
ncbi:MAG: DinB family protein [Aeromicrobium sp.]